MLKASARSFAAGGLQLFAAVLFLKVLMLSAALRFAATKVTKNACIICGDLIFGYFLSRKSNSLSRGE